MLFKTNSNHITNTKTWGIYLGQNRATMLCSCGHLSIDYGSLFFSLCFLQSLEVCAFSLSKCCSAWKAAQLILKNFLHNTLHICLRGKTRRQREQKNFKSRRSQAVLQKMHRAGPRAPWTAAVAHGKVAASTRICFWQPVLADLIQQREPAETAIAHDYVSASVRRRGVNWVSSF